MYTVGAENLLDGDEVAEAVELMRDAMIWAEAVPYASGLQFIGDTYEATNDPARFSVIGLAGKVTGIIAEPPSFTLLVDDANVQTDACDCPGFDPGEIFTNFEQVLANAELSRELDEFAGAETKDPHRKDLPHLVGTEKTVRFDRLGCYIVTGTIPGIIG
ncbi:MAG: hypothetical protein WBP26_03385 [Candidatus Saccharimonadales bacterium]